jgi:tRNA threonylcarbamoyladenosine biosynthesis protein TsaE
VTIEKAPPATHTTVVETASPDETADFARALAEVAVPGDRIALSGPLGAGKTVFAKGFARGLGVRDVVNSPSFTLMAEYEGRLRLFHQDLYRLSGAEDAIAGGLLDDRQEDGVTLTEWADRLPSELDPARLAISIGVLEGDRRRLSVHVSGEHHHRYVDATSRWLRARTGRRA